MRILLDAHLSPVLAQRLRRRGIDAASLVDWQGGVYRTARDEAVLSAAHDEQRVLVTYDVRTVPRLVKEWAQVGRHHSGVLLVSERTFHSNDIGALYRALGELFGTDEDWQDRMSFLQRKHWQ